MIAAAPGLADATFSPWALLVGVALLIANGTFTATEIALLATRRGRIESAADEGDRRASAALRSLRDLSTTFSGTQLGVTLSSLGLGAVAEPAVASALVRLMGASALPDALVPGLAVAIALAIVVFLHMVVGDMAPKNLALARPEEVALALARPFRLFVAAFKPLIIVLRAASHVVLRLLRVEPVAEHKLVHTPEELALVLTDSRQRGAIAAQDANVMGAALRLTSTTAGAAMTPRVDLVALSDESTVDELLEVAAETGVTRVPIYHGDLDAVVGVVHVKDAIVQGEVARTEGSVMPLLRPILAVPAARDLERLLREMLAGRHHALLVVDEFGATAGLLTLEDVLEELVGDIADEFDERPQDVRRDTRVWTVAGTTRRDELERLTGLDLQATQAETVSGWMVEQLGRLLDAGDVVVTDQGWQLHVMSVEHLRAGEIEVRAPARDDRESATEGPGDDLYA